jgi:hypothetical protein
MSRNNGKIALKKCINTNHGQIAKKIEEVNISLKSPLERQFAKKRPKMSASAIVFFGAIDPY